MSNLFVSQRLHVTRQLARTVHPSLVFSIARPRTNRGLSTLRRSQPESTVVTDASVPEGHKGLHGFLYGDGGAENHDSSGYAVRKGEDDGSTLMPVTSYLEDRDGEKPLGVYAIYDSCSNIQYVGYSRNIVLAVRGHLARVGEERCTLVRAMVFANRAMATRANLEQEVHNWLREFGTLPPGNGVERELWEGPSGGSSSGSSSSSGGNGSSSSSGDTSAMSPAELAEYEEKKLKMRKAMGENLNDDVQGETVDARQRRLNTIMAVEGDNWSAVIDQQTQATAPTTQQPAAAAAGSSQPVVSPFTSASVHRSVGASEAAAAAAAPQQLEMTVESADKVLDEVRPYLLADGGDVEVAAVKDGVVYLTLQGSCSSCASQSVTMKMGIERALKAAFGERLKDVVQVGQKDPAATVELVDLQLNMLRSAIHSLGGSVEVMSVVDGKCELKYTGPAPIAKGISAAIKDRFHDIREVIFL